jgi:hypothetical protein
MASNLQHGRGSALWRYWTKGPGLLLWRLSPHPWTTLRAALAEEGVPAHELDGLTTNIYVAVFGHGPTHK